MAERYDLVAIGAGPAGETATAIAAYFGHRAAIVERHRPGGTVTTTGGVPTKTLREAALYVTGFHHRNVYGLDMAMPPEIAVNTIAERTRSVSALLQDATAANIASRGVDYLYGTARLGPDRSVLVNQADGTDRVLAATAILIATGSRPVRPSAIAFGDPDVYDTDELFGLEGRLATGAPGASPSAVTFDDPDVYDAEQLLGRGGGLPKDALIIGGGPVGVECATVLTALQVPVTLADTSHRLLPQMDGELALRMAQSFEERGVRLIYGVRAEAIERQEGKLSVALSDGTVLHPDAVLFAAGRRANTEGLGLAEAGVELDARGRIVVDRRYQTTAEGIYAAGDVLGPTLASIAMEQGVVAACHAFDIDLKGAVDPLAVSAVYGMPEVAGAGLTEEQCREHAIDYEVGRCEFAGIPRGAIAGHGGLLKLLFRKDDRRLLGVHCLGDIASELVGIGQMVLHYGGNIEVFVTQTMNTPTYSFAYKYAAYDGLKRLERAGAFSPPRSR